ncbi:PAS domain-containing protein [Bradyrhizobium japonicum]|uniref:PAS-domain containing protein n=1 Tax=Bradyrhizobium japonicum TaxID=375 RepID=UPI0021671D7F|nr:PAS-domain containing protein [Bradyrhizobium japonicum]MCS3499662.1 PAS domain-containing protein [Bradyrhizobium japonicum]MCS3958176.1 PAS domain-containing protein [Bradyrhizobium japonicum]MCS3999929.1 PAS domain-containing protein [Bradyrhizobium japonicum]
MRAPADELSAHADRFGVGCRQYPARQRPDLRDRDGVARDLHVHRTGESKAIRGRVGQVQRRAHGGDDALGADCPSRRSRAIRGVQTASDAVHRLSAGTGAAGLEISPAAAREWGDNQANRTVRSKLNADLEALQRSYDKRAREADQLADENRYAAWYLFMLGLAALVLAAINVLVMRDSVVGRLSDIAQATDRIAAGDIKSEVPHLMRHDEIGHLARNMQHFRDAMQKILELEQLEFNTAQQRDAAITQRDQFNDKYQAKKWQLSAAINSMPQGLIMLDGRANFVAMNNNYRRIYNLPETIRAGSTLEKILQHRIKSGLFSDDIAKHLAAILDRIARREPTAYEIALNDGRTINIYERPMDGGGWVSVHEDVTDLRHGQRMLERTERLLATIVENVHEGIIAKDARSLRYLFVNKAAEKMIGMSRAEIVGRTANCSPRRRPT